MSTDLGGRYGNPRTSRLAIAVVAVVVLAALVWTVWAVGGTSDPDVTSGQVSFEVQGQHRAVTTIQVKLRSADIQATCLLQAQAADHTVVGEAHVKVPQNRGRDVTLTETIRTARQATAVTLVGCTSPDQKRPR